MNSKRLILSILSTFLFISFFIACDDGSNDVSFPSDPPTINAFKSDSLVAGETLIIQGTNFSAVPAQNQVTFNGATSTARASTSTEIEVEIPEGAKSGEVTVTINSNSATSPEPLHILMDIPREGLLFFLPFDQNANDLIGGKVADVQGARLTSDRFDRVNSAYSFNGASYIAYPNEGLTPLEGLTVSSWVFITSFHHTSFLNNYNTSILGPGGYSLDLGGIDQQWVTGIIGCYLGGTGANTAIPLLEWFNVTMTFDESFMDLWINGDQVLHHPISKNLTIPYHELLVLGGSQRSLENGMFMFQGRLDDVAIYDRVLSENDIQQLYNQTVTTKSIQTYNVSFPSNHPHTPIEGPTVEDREGNIYRIATIGDQTWMIDNLKSTTCSDGTALANFTDNGVWEYEQEAAYCWYNNDQVNMKEVYGGMYNFYAVSGVCNICPDGWRVPTIDEWNILIEHLGGSEIAGGEMKTEGYRYWRSANYPATNNSGFSAVGGGGRFGGQFTVFGANGFYWSSSPGTRDTPDDSGQSVALYNYNGSISINPKQFLNAGLSVRCIKD